MRSPSLVDAEILEANPGNEKFVERLFRIGAANNELLWRVSEMLDAPDLPPSILCFAQIAAPIHLNAAPLQVYGSTKEIRAEVCLTPLSLETRADGTPALHTEDPRGVARPIGTQAVVRLFLWGARVEAYRAYRAAIASRSNSERVIVRASKSWHRRHTPFDASGYETDIARRSLKEVDDVLHKVLAAATRASLTNIQTRTPPAGYFIMAAPLRLASHGPARPLVDDYLTRVEANARILEVQSEYIQPLLNSSLRAGGIEEDLSILRAELVSRRPELAVVYAAAVVEWILNTTFRGVEAYQDSAVRLLAKPDFPIHEDGLRLEILWLAKLRNSLVHGGLVDPSRLATESGSDGKPEPLCYDDADRAFGVAREVIRWSHGTGSGSRLPPGFR